MDSNGIGFYNEYRYKYFTNIINNPTHVRCLLTNRHSSKFGEGCYIRFDADITGSPSTLTAVIDISTSKTFNIKQFVAGSKWVLCDIVSTDGVFINDAKVTVADIEADNGVVHVIDAVLLPPPSSSTDYLMDNTLDIYPNPAKDKITIESAIINNEPAQVNITTVNGQNVLSTEVFFGNSIDISILDAGIYFLKVKTKDNLSIKKLVKQ
jgi:hypothetical protein